MLHTGATLTLDPTTAMNSEHLGYLDRKGNVWIFIGDGAYKNYADGGVMYIEGLRRVFSPLREIYLRQENENA